MIKIIVILVAIYIAGGIYRIIFDFRQPSINQPDYVRHPSLGLILLVMVMWFPFLVMDIKNIGIRRMWKEHKRMANLAKKEREIRKSERDIFKGGNK